MKKRIWCITLLSLFASCLLFAAPDLPASLSASLEDNVEQQDVSIMMYDASGSLAKDNITTLDFNFPTDQEEWEVSQTVQFAYGSNLLLPKHSTISFTVSPLQFDPDNIVDTQLSFSSKNPDVIVTSKGFIIQFHAGYCSDISLGEVKITARKPATQKLAAGDYVGSISVNLESGE